MFELADRLVGIYKTHDATKSVTINPKVFGALELRGQSQGKQDDEQESSAVKRASLPLADSTNVVR